MPKLSAIVLSLMLLCLGGTCKGPILAAPSQESSHSLCTHLKDGRITIFVHGTVFPGISRFFDHHEGRRGLYHYCANPQRLTSQQHLAKSLHRGASDEFPLDSFYRFYWSGELTLSARKNAAQELFKLLKDHKGPCTLIAHSHGCNVALHLAEMIPQCKDPIILVDRLVLLAPPVQEVTEHLVHSPIFKRVYSCYSTADVIQIADPQGLHGGIKSVHKKGSLFSRRTYKPSTNLTQAQITLHNHSPGHREFIRPSFFRQLPDILKLLDTSRAKNLQHIHIDLPFKGQTPYLIEKNQEKRMMRTHYSSSKHRK